MNALELFAGIGDIALSEQMAGINIIGLCEYADFPRAVLQKHWPAVPLFKDVKTLDRDKLKNGGWTPTQLTLFPEASLASLTVSPGTAEAQKMTVISGRKCLESSNLSGQLGSLERMLLTSPTWNSTERYLTWKALGTRQGHLYFQLSPSAPRISGYARSLSPTPTASDGSAWKRVKKDDVIGSLRRALAPKKGKRHAGTMRDTYLLQALEYSPKQAAEFQEMMMGYPVGWTDLKR
jgi:hypothetical protein